LVSRNKGEKENILLKGVYKILDSGIIPISREERKGKEFFKEKSPRPRWV
jgi:hypothetical protein